jgi:hypothetical protein
MISLVLDVWQPMVVVWSLLKYPTSPTEDMLMLSFPVIFGPAAATWYKFLQHKVRLPHRKAEILARVAADQCLFAPTNLFVFLSTMAITEGSDPKGKLNKTYKTALMKNWTVWPFVQLTTFGLVPLEHRVMFVNVIAIGVSFEHCCCYCLKWSLTGTGT